MNDTCRVLLLGLLTAGFWPCPFAVGGEEERGGRAERREALIDEGAAAASHFEIEPLAIDFKRLTGLRLQKNGDLLASDADAKEIKIIDPQGELKAKIQLEFGAEAIALAPDGTIYCGGQNVLAKLDGTGKLLKSAAIPEEFVPKLSEKRRRRSRGPRVSGLAVTERDVFVACGSGWSMGSKSKLFRVNRDLEDPQPLADGLRGCCQRCDIVTWEGALFLAENSAHRIVCYDREGKVLGKWGKRSRTGLDGFGSCCNPMNLDFDAHGVLYTAESGMGRVKRYSREGAYLGLVGYVGVERFRRAGRQASSCSNIAIAVTPTGARVYVMDYSDKRIRVLQRFD